VSTSVPKLDFSPHRGSMLVTHLLSRSPDHCPASCRQLGSYTSKTWLSTRTGLVCVDVPVDSLVTDPSRVSSALAPVPRLGRSVLDALASSFRLGKSRIVCLTTSQPSRVIVQVQSIRRSRSARETRKIRIGSSEHTVQLIFCVYETRLVQ
jgi:hypothetical protein